MTENVTIFQTESVRVVDECRAALQGLRSALIELYAAVGLDPTQPQEVARRLKLNRNLTWKLSKVVAAHDAFSTLNHLPGQQGMDLALEAFGEAGAPAAALAGVQAALAEFTRLTVFHAENRDQLELTLESMGLFEREAKLESGRELAYRGNSMIWGVQAKTFLHVNLVQPSRHKPDAHDFVLVGGYIGFRRLRPSARWRLLRAKVHDQLGQDTGDRIEEFETKGPNDPPLLIREFCSPGMPPVEVVPVTGARELYLPGGQVGNQAAFDCVSGLIARGMAKYWAPDDEIGGTSIGISVPCEQLILDLLFHKDVGIPPNMELHVHGFPLGGVDMPNLATDQNLLPITTKFVELAGSPPAVATARFPRYREMIDRVYKRVDANPADFRGVRAVIEFPPMNTRVAATWKLPKRPDGSSPDGASANGKA